ncbi:related to monooxigenase [Ramularia collo-cygni]|uniref:Related to monooxigenase n=1 Tax=Ramularia collo-cygni TaxID=112498 RepID=A0A2D3V6N7_9PEZI|nr:related to monooxigenase [Ramularia collo-cygni]CZT21100.1 related to monooxigenase [Ramularia collo-cygni]
MTITLEERYRQEREKRTNSKHLGQYLDRSQTSPYILTEDPWVQPGTPINRPVPEGGHVKIVIFGAGFGGLCAAVRALQTGAARSLEDILIVDYAGGFGGTWWHNRYPGLMCDCESYIYLPLLEETGYMPTRRFAGGEEIRQYSDLLAKTFGLHGRAMFQTRGRSLTWDDEAKNWACEVAVKPKGGKEYPATFTADFVVLSSGGFTDPKLPDLSGMDKYEGKMLHTGRWNYDITGGSPANPELTELKGKRVAIVGTGATAMQAVPATAKWAKELYVFQRTASSVDIRNNRDTDPEEWKTKIANKKGWQIERAANFQRFVEGPDNRPEVNMVDDGFSHMPSLGAAWGNSSQVSPNDIESYVAAMLELDRPRSERVRQRALDIVKDQETAKSLQAWYPGWCKRPTFHDEYLQAFNEPNVHLVDTDGKGVEALYPEGITQNGKEYPIDVIIWSTGYGSPLTESLAGKALIKVIGKNGHDMEDRFGTAQLMSLHGIAAHHFPNLFFTGLSQAGVGANQTSRLDEQSVHIAHIIKEAEKMKKATSGEQHTTVVVEATEEACEAWGDKVAGIAHMAAPMQGCLPSYFNGEGMTAKFNEAQQKGAARSALWGHGFTDYARILAEWREKGELEGFAVTAAV